MIKTSHHTSFKTGALFAGVLAAGLPGAIAQNATAPAPAPSPAAGAPIPVAEVKKPYWEVSAALGATVTSGNSESVMVTAGILAQHKDLKNEMRLSLDGGYGNSTVNNQPSGTTSQFIRGAAQYNRLFTERFYVYARVDGLYDRVAGVDYRFTFSPGAGYYFIKTDKVLLSGEVGPGVVTERIVSTGGRSDYNTYATIRFAQNFEYKLSDKTRIWQSLEYLPQIDDWGNNYLINATVGIETALTTKLSLRTFLVNNYNSAPAAGRENNDLKWITGIAYKF